MWPYFGKADQKKKSSQAPQGSEPSGAKQQDSDSSKQKIKVSKIFKNYPVYLTILL